MANALHFSQDSNDGIHIIHAWEYANATNRNNHTPAAGPSAALLASDIGKACRQTDTDQWYILTNHSPITWVRITNGQESDPGALTDNTGGAVDGTLAQISGSGADANINNNFADLAAKYNAIRTILQNLDLVS